MFPTPRAIMMANVRPESSSEACVSVRISNLLMGRDACRTVYLAKGITYSSPDRA